MAANSNRLRGALLASSALVAGVSGSARWASTASAQNILPTNGVITSGAASIRQSSADLSIVQTSPRAIVNWGSFSIGQGNASPSPSRTHLRRSSIASPARRARRIAGQLNANGQVYLVNPNGIAITPHRRRQGRRRLRRLDARHHRPATSTAAISASPAMARRPASATPARSASAGRLRRPARRNRRNSGSHRPSRSARSGWARASRRRSISLATISCKWRADRTPRPPTARRLSTSPARWSQRLAGRCS